MYIENFVHFCAECGQEWKTYDTDQDAQTMFDHENITVVEINGEEMFCDPCFEAIIANNQAV